MSLDGILGTAASGIKASANAMAVISQNVANAGTTGYVKEAAVQTSLTAQGVGYGVRTGPTQRMLDAQLQAANFAQDATVAGLATRQQSLAGLDSVQGTTGNGDDLPGLLAKLQGAFNALQTDPANQTQQSAVVAAAATLTGQLNTLSQAVGTARQSAQDDAVGAIADINTGLQKIGALSDTIMRQQAAGQSTADLESQRDAVIGDVNKIVPLTVVRQSSGDVLLIASGALTLPIRGDTALALAPASLGSGAGAQPAAPSVTLGGRDVTQAITGGRLGSDLALRDTAMPTYQAGLDEFAFTLASRFDAQGLTLFTDGSGQIPAAGGSPTQSGYLGFAGTIQVNPVAAAAPSVVRDGLQGTAATTPSGLAGDTSLITKILNYALGAQQSDGVAQPAPATTGLGAAGTLSLPYAAPATLGAFSSVLVASMSGDNATAKTNLDAATAVQTTLQARLASTSGVSIDQEMSTMIQIQNGYAANGKVISAVQAMWTSLLAMVN